MYLFKYYYFFLKFQAFPPLHNNLNFFAEKGLLPALTDMLKNVSFYWTAPLSVM